MKDIGATRSPIGQLDTALYAQSMLRELREIVTGSRLDELGYMVEMAYLAAGDAVRRASATDDS